MTIPERILAQVSPRSVGGVSLFNAGERITAETVPNFFSEQNIINTALTRLQQAGFEVLQVTQTTINIAGSKATYDQAFNAQIYEEERPVIKPGAMEATATFIDSPTADLPGLISTQGTSLSDVIEGVAIEEPRYYAQKMFPPSVGYWHLDVPADVSLGCNADRVHRTGITGKDIKVAMVDSGQFRHPFFVNRGYRVRPVVLGPGASNPLRDEIGHGTGESANIFAVAPDVELHPVKLLTLPSGAILNTTGGFNSAVGLNPDIITCSWGSNVQFGPLSAANLAQAASVASAVASGIVVIFSAGNGSWSFPGQHPDVISAGGVFMEADGSMRASDYASGFISNVYPNRRVPDLSGLVGMRPKAAYIMLPLEPGDSIDTDRAGGSHPNGDETAPDDGWAAFSGTSAAAPQLAGAAALVKQACTKLTPADVRDILMRSARDVTVGNCSPGTGANPATVGPDTATGNGLVDAHKAVLLAKIRCLGPITPGPIPPGPITPGPITPGPGPITPGPITPGPITPAPIPPQPITGPQAQPPSQGQQIPPEQQQSGVPLTEEDIQALEDMVIRSDLDIEQTGDM